MTKAAVLLNGGVNYTLGDRVRLFASLDDALYTYRACETFGSDPTTKLGTPCWGDGHEAGAVVGYAWKHDHDNAEVIAAENLGEPITLDRFTYADDFNTLFADYHLVKLPRGGYKWKKATA